MPAPKNIDGSSSVPAFYGKELRWKREAAGRTLQGTVDGSFFAPSYLSEIERGTRRMPLELARHVDRFLETDGFFERRCEDVRKARQGAHASYFAPIAESEKRARVIEEWSSAFIPGLLQTEAYARAVIRSTHPLDLREEADAKVRARMERAELFNDPKRPEYWVILHASLVQDPDPMLPSSEMAEQLSHIASLARSGRVPTQVLPWNAATRPFMALSLTFMEFSDEPPFMYTEAPYHGQIVDDPALVKQYRKAYDRLRAAALSPEASLALIDEAAEDYGNGKHRD
ncbi:helix-turn-helix domain-containing protein [Streptomyces pinistramenti]|uniref:helix-turn-helix domain-containing protein n=1 Tax=Streptomyces pinistramenti TaxID=2884812 RepID=UPI001D07FBD7|nr:helix-turn-helix transcriptional regulator [Streptomyces pinistramenti]MCB5907865.1 helix-turn-helix transcriptional regulator [Streptomyces pinistramenti]